MARSHQAASPRRRGLRWLKWLGIGLASLIGLLLLLVAGTFLYLSTDAGGERLRGLVVSKANAAIEGRLSIGALALHGGHLWLRDVVLDDPRGREVARVKSLEVRVALPALLHKTVELSVLRIHAPQVHLIQDAQGTNLQRAIASRHPSPAKPSSGKSSLGFSIDDLQLDGGMIDLLQRSTGPERRVHLEGLTGRGHARLSGDQLAAKVTLNAQVSEPLTGKLAVALEASGTGEGRRAGLTLSLGDARLTAHATMQDAEHGALRIDSLLVPVDVVRAFVPSYPLRVPVRVQGRVSKGGSLASVNLDARAGAASAALSGSFDLARHRSDGLQLQVRHVNLAELTADGPASDVALDLEAAGGGTSADDLAGRVSLFVPPSMMQGEHMGPVRLSATADHGHFELKELTANVPGLSLTAKGSGSRARMALSGTLTAHNLSAFSHTLGRLGKKHLSLSGAGRLTLAASGPVKDPALQLDAAFPTLRFQDKRASHLVAHVKLPAVRQPARAQVSVRASRVALDRQRWFRNVWLEAHGDGEVLSLKAQVHGFADLALALTAKPDPDNRGGVLQTFSLRYPEARWRLTAPVRIAARGGSLHVGRMALRADRQSIALQANKRGSRIHARISVKGLALSRLPKALVSPSLRLAGRVDVAAKVDGSVRSPRIVAKVDLRRGRFKKYKGLSLHLDATYSEARAKGALAAKGAGVNVSGDFDVPVKALRTGGREPVRVELKLAQLELGPWLKTLGVDKPVQGRAAANLSLSGTASDPRLNLVATLRGLKVRSAPAANLTLTAQSDEAGPLRAGVDLELAGKKSEVALRTPFTLGELLRKPPRRAALLAASIQLDAKLRALPLTALSQAGLVKSPLQGTLSGQARVRGPARALTGTLSVAARGLARQGSPAMDGEVKLELGPELHASFFVARGDQVWVDATARIAASSAALQDPAKLSRAPVSLHAQLGPLSIAQLQRLTQPTDVDPLHAQAPLEGTLRGSLDASGTLHDPKLTLAANVDKLSVNHQKETGDLALSFVYAQAREALAVALHSQGGHLEVKANTEVDLSYPKVRNMKDLAGTAVSASLVAERFNPAFLSHLSPMIDALGGELDGKGKVWGTLGAPQAAGQLEWKNGVLGTRGYGDFRQLHLLAQASNDRYELKDLSMKSGDGSAKLTGHAQRQGKRFQLHAVAHLDKFPAMSDGELMATLSLDATADGHATASRVFIQSLTVPEAHVQLPDVKKKDLQKLAAAKDIVLTRDGKPIKGQKLARAAVSPAGRGVGGSGSAGGPTPFRAVVRVHAPRNIWIQGNDIDTEIGFSDNFRVEYAGALQLFGDVLLQRGRLDVFGRRFDWQKGSKVTFSGAMLEPDLDVTAVYKNETEQVTVYLKAQGQGDEVQLTPTSDPPLSETEIYTLLATGHVSLRHGSGNTSPAGQAASLVGSFAAGQLKKTLSGVLPLDVFSIEAGDRGLQGTKVEAGTYVNDRLYLGFTGRVGADPMKGENSNEVDVDYQLSKHWSLEGSYGDAQAGGADLVWQKDY